MALEMECMYMFHVHFALILLILFIPRWLQKCLVTRPWFHLFVLIFKDSYQNNTISYEKYAVKVYPQLLMKVWGSLHRVMLWPLQWSTVFLTKHLVDYDDLSFDTYAFPAFLQECMCRFFSLRMQIVVLLQRIFSGFVFFID